MTDRTDAPTPSQAAPRPLSPARVLPPAQPLRHWADDGPFDPQSAARLTPEQERYYLASQWRLMWWKLKRHHLAVISLFFLAFSYLSILVAEVIAPYALDARHTDHLYAPPQGVHLFHEGEFVGPFVYPYTVELDLTQLRWVYTEDTARPQPLRFLCSPDDYTGARYRFWGGPEMGFHLVCPPEGGTFFLMGTDRLGRDIFSRVTYGARISLTVGLVGIILSFALGIVIGGVAGYYGGFIDTAVQRVIEVIRSFPTLPLLMALSAALPVTWSPILVFLGVTVILALLDWPGLARAVRSKFLSLRVLLNEAQNFSAVALYPWIMFPMLPVILVVLAFQFLGDGLRDAADPYSGGGR